MPLFGSHLSIAGGYYLAAESAAKLGFDCVQIFTKNNNQWRAKPISDEDVRLFSNAMSTGKLTHPISHSSYLINLASGADELWNKSVDAMVVELERAHQLGIPHVVTHPGAHCGDGDEKGIARICQALDLAFERTKTIKTTVALETTAGQGSSIGCKFEHFSEILRQCKYSDRLTICVDTCHLFAAGYPLAPKKSFLDTFRQLDQAVDLNRVVAFHLNDSKKDFGSRVDRHEHIGKGKIGPDAFQLLLKDKRFKKTPMYLETEKGVDESTGREWDSINLDMLKSLLK